MVRQSQKLPHLLLSLNMIFSCINKKGFTLIELLIYIGISLIVITSLLSTAWIVIQDQIKQERFEEVYSTGTFILDKISYLEKRANTLAGSTVYDTNPGKITLTFTSNPSITIDTYQKDITIAGSTITITKLRWTEGSNPSIDLTSDRVNVSQFILKDLSSGSAKTTKIDMTLESVNPTGSTVYGAQYTWSSTITKRSK